MPDNSLTAMARKEWTNAVPQKESDYIRAAVEALFKNMPGMKDFKAPGSFQKSELGLVVHVIMAKASDTDPITIWVSLENSSVSSGRMTYDEAWEKGYYQDQVEVEMWLEDLKGNARTDMRRIADGPKTANGSGSTSSAISFSFSGSGNLGFFGGTPTGGASASVGATESHSFSQNLTDFKVINYSDQYRAKHTYKMAESSGAKYDKAIDLVPKGDAIGFTEAFKGIQLYSPPDIATSNLSLLSQCVWQARDNREIKEDLNLKIRVTQKTVKVTGSNNFFTVDASSSGYKIDFGHSERLPLSQLVYHATQSALP